MRRFAQDADAGPQDQRTNPQAEEGIDPVRTGFANDDCADDDRDVGKAVAEIVNQDAPKIEVAARANERQGDAAVHRQSCHGGPHHPFFHDLHGRAQALDGFITEPERKQNQYKGVGKGGQRAGAMIAVSLLAVGGALGPAHRQIGDAESGNIGKVVDGIVEQRDAAAKNATENFSND